MTFLGWSIPLAAARGGPAPRSHALYDRMIGDAGPVALCGTLYFWSRVGRFPRGLPCRRCNERHERRQARGLTVTEP